LIGAAPIAVEIPVAALVEREPVTVLFSQKGWIRAVKGHNVNLADQKYKEGDGPRFAVPAETTDRLIVFGTNGRFYTLAADKLPGGRGQGEPIRLMIDLPNEHDIVALFPYRPGFKLLVASNDGRGFLVDGEEALAQTRAGKQVLTAASGARAAICVAAGGDTAAFVGENAACWSSISPKFRRWRAAAASSCSGIVPAALPTPRCSLRQKGSRGGRAKNRTRTEFDLTPWRGARGAAGRSVPQGFPALTASASRQPD